MSIKNLIVASIALAAATSSFAQQTEHIQPAAGFNSSLTRAEVRRDFVKAYNEGSVAQRRHDGQDTRYVGSTRTRADVRAAIPSISHVKRAGDVKDLYFGA